MPSLPTIKSAMYDTHLTYNSRGDFIAKEYNGDLTVAIPAKHSIHIKHVDVIGLTLTVLTIMGILGAFIGIIMFAGNSWIGVGSSIAVLLVLLTFIAILLGTGVAPGSLLQPKNRYYDVGSYYFEKPGDNKRVENDMLEVLDNDDVRDDFIKLLAAVEDKNIEFNTARDLYANMKEVAFADKKVSRLELENIAKQYEFQANAIREISNI